MSLFFDTKDVLKSASPHNPNFKKWFQEPKWKITCYYQNRYVWFKTLSLLKILTFWSVNKKVHQGTVCVKKWIWNFDFQKMLSKNKAFMEFLFEKHFDILKSVLWKVSILGTFFKYFVIFSNQQRIFKHFYFRMLLDILKCKTRLKHYF